MQEYRCRTLKPEESGWKTVSAESVEDAANDYHFDSGIGARLKSARFSIVEVEGHDRYIARSFHYGIGRIGGIKPPRMQAPSYYCDTFEQVAQLLDVSVDKLTDDDFIGDERLEEEKEYDRVRFAV